MASTVASPSRPSARPVRRPRTSRSDGADTRQRILDIAGQVFAEKGHGRATSKEICAAAGVNLAAVNYHFGGKDGLYQAVLVEAHGHLVSLDDLRAIAGDGTAPEKQFDRLLRRLLEPKSPRARPAWALRVLVQEMMAPSPHVPVLIRKAVLPKVKVLFSLVSRVLGVAPDHPGVQRAVAFAVVPCFVLLVAPQPMRRHVLPAIDTDPAHTVDELVAYSLAGLRALGRRHRASTSPA